MRKLDIDLFDDEGRLCVRLGGFSTRAADAPAPADVTATTTLTASTGPLLFTPQWTVAAAPTAPTAEHARRQVLLSSELQHLATALKAVLPGAGCEVLPARPRLSERYEAATLALLQAMQSTPSAARLVQLVHSTDGDAACMAGLSGLLKTARHEHPQLIAQAIGLAAAPTANALVAALNDAARRPDEAVLRYDGGQPSVPSWQEFAPAAPADWSWRDGSVVLITGGAGGIGWAVAREIAAHVDSPVLVLSGRSPLDDDKRRRLEALHALGAEAVYRQADVTDALAVRGLVEGIVESFGGLHTILHAAGVVHDGFLLKKTAHDARAVLAPKVAGLLALDDATRELVLDRFVLFSSVSAALGNAGQGDYAAANAFMDAFAARRNEGVRAGRRHGRTLAVNWPLWEEGGMGGDEVREHVRAQGWDVLSTAAGVQAMLDALASGADRVMVIAGRHERIRAKLLRSATPKAEPAGVESGALQRLVASALRQSVSAMLKVSVDEIELDAELSEYGMDSIRFTQLANELNRRYGLSLVPTVFFEHTSL
ncbi:MAG TPA: beta-ketoacyl reductase, partial [Albitalea sp.]